VQGHPALCRSDAGGRWTDTDRSSIRCSCSDCGTNRCTRNGGRWYALALMERLPVDALPILLRALDLRMAMYVGCGPHAGEDDGAAGCCERRACGCGTGGAAQRKMAAVLPADFGLSTSETESALLGRLMMNTRTSGWRPLRDYRESPATALR